MSKPLTIAYVMVSDGRGRYPAMAFVSASAAPRIYPDARLVLVTDEDTPLRLRESYPRLLDLFDQIAATPTPMSGAHARGFYLKTRVRNLIDGDFVYLDVDTLPVRQFDDVFARDFDLALVQDRNHHCPIDPVFPHWEELRMRRLGWMLPLTRYFNTGVMFSRDTPAARRVWSEWERLWHQGYATGDDWDQLALNVAVHTMPANVLELPPAYNAMVTVHPVHARGARVYHFFTGNPGAWRQTVFEYLLGQAERAEELDWQTADRCVAMDHPWLPPYWPWRLWQTGNRAKAVRLFAAKAARRLLGRGRMIRRVREGLGWRWQRLQRCVYLRCAFRNGAELVSCYRHKRPCGRAVCLDGTEFRHPADRRGLVETILEVWFNQVYTGDFYHPRPGDVVIDAGANVGLFAVWLARRHHGCRVVAFEPFDENYRLLCDNIRSARATVKAHHAGLGGSSGRGRMAEGGSRSLDHRLEPATDGAVPVYSFADVLKMTDPDRVALFKIDIEGSEFDLFTSVSAADLARVERYAIEYHDNLRPGTLDLLRTRLEPTHAVTVRPASDDGGYGMLYAVKREDR